MEFIVCQEPKRHLDLLLLADPYEPMIDRYLSKSIVLTAEEKGKTVGLVAYWHGPGVFGKPDLL